MDPATAFALAASILQVVDFSKNLLSTGYQLYQDGSTISNSDFMLVADDLSSLNDKIKTFARPNLSVSGPLAIENQALENLASELQKVADELTLTLHRIRLKEEKTVFRSFRQAIVTMWNKKKIDGTIQRMDSIREEVQFHLIVSMVDKVDRVDVKADASIQSLDNATKSIVESIFQGNIDLSAILATQTSKSMEREDAREAAAVERHNDISAKIDQLTQYSGVNLGHPDNSRKQREKAVLRQIKHSLDFPRQEDRYDTIKTAHKATFEWSFQDSHEAQALWNNFNVWLHSKSSLYWMSGKAGSGKSTLMKFIAQDNLFKAAMKLWAGELPLIIASYYFWNPGDTLQKSQEGLLRTVLLKVLEQRPSLAPLLFPEHYKLGINWTGVPTFHQLRRAFERLVVQTDGMVNIVLVVDGLDEFEPTDASYTDLADMFIAAARSPNFKVLLSSRPLSAFEASFADYPKLRLHELTKPDIETFVNDRLRRHSRIIDLSEDDADGAEALISEIVSASSGVFFWVKLVVDLLLEGFQNFDTLEDLRHKLKTVPRDLDDLFTRMLRHIPEEYKVQSSKIFQILRCNDDADQHLADRNRPGRCEMTASVLYFAEFELEKILKAEISPISPKEQENFIKEVEGRLRSRCAGLVELSRDSTDDDKKQNDPVIALMKHKLDPVRKDRQVQYLHRSVADWAQKKHIWDEISAHTAYTFFEPTVSILQALVMKLKCLTARKGYRDRFLILPWELVNACMTFAKQAEYSTGQGQVAILNELNRVMERHADMTRKMYRPSEYSLQLPWGWSSWCDSVQESYKRPTRWHDDFLAFTIRHGLSLYVQNTVEAYGVTLPNKKGRPYLDYACNPGLIDGLQSKGTQQAIVKILLEHGADPNENFDGSSPWHNSLCYPLVLGTQEASNPWLDIIKLLVHHGADPGMHVFKTRVDNEQNSLIHGIMFDGSASGAIRHYVENGVWTIAEQRAELLDYAQKLEKLSARAQQSTVETGNATDGAKLRGVRGKRTKEKASKDKSVKRSVRRALRDILKW